MVLTKSIKYKEYCVAGINIINGEWVRLVTDDELCDGAVHKGFFIYNNNEPCMPLDLVEIHIKENYISPDIQYENVLIDESKPIKKIGEIGLDELLKIHPIENPDFIFVDKHSTLLPKKIHNLKSSLTIVKVENFRTYVNSNNKTKARFIYNNAQYCEFSVTDPDFTKNIIEHGSAYLVLSLPEHTYNDKYFKLIAKIFINE
ncbi:MAG: dual OB domain-containing protein [Methanobacteriaceae archaeon]